MKKPTDNIKNPKVKTYIEEITKGQKPTGKITADEYEEGITQFAQGIEKALDEADEMIARAKLGNVPEAISFSFIAKNYFGKSRAWLMQKINGNTVNGKRAAFTDEERRKFRDALQDISRQLSIAARAF